MHLPGNSRRYSFKALATMGISYRSRTSCATALPLLIALRRWWVAARGTSTSQMLRRASSPSKSG